MKLMQAMAGAPRGGAENFFLRLAVALQDKGIDQGLLIRDHKDWAGALSSAGIPVRVAQFGGALDFATRNAFLHALTEWSPDAILTWMGRATRFCPRRGKMRDTVHVATPRNYDSIKVYKSSDHLITTTEDVAAHFVKQNWPRERIDVIPTFVKDSTGADPEPRHTHDTPDGAPLVLALGRIHPAKGFDTLLDAMATLPEHWLWLAGAGPDEEALKEKAKDLGVAERVRFLGWRDDIEPLFNAADLFVCPSRHEPFGSIIVEAWAHRTPMVATASQGPGALIENDVTGLLTPIDDPAELAATISRLTGDPALQQSLVSAGRAVYEAHHTMDVVAEAYIGAIQRAIDLGKMR